MADRPPGRDVLRGTDGDPDLGLDREEDFPLHSLDEICWMMECEGIGQKTKNRRNLTRWIATSQGTPKIAKDWMLWGHAWSSFFLRVFFFKDSGSFANKKRIYKSQISLWMSSFKEWTDGDFHALYLDDEGRDLSRGSGELNGNSSQEMNGWSRFFSKVTESREWE